MLELWVVVDRPYRELKIISLTHKTVSNLILLMALPILPAAASLLSPSSPSPTSRLLPITSAPITSSPRAARKPLMSFTKVAFKIRTTAVGSRLRSSLSWLGPTPSSSLYFLLDYIGGLNSDMGFIRLLINLCFWLCSSGGSIWGR